MKHATACPQCRSTKRKCAQDPADLQAACLACQSRKIECSRPWNKQKSHRSMSWNNHKARLAPSISATEQQDKLPVASPEAIESYVQLYFRFIHDRPHSLFHEASLWTALRNGTLPESLKAAICALGCRFSSEPDQRELATTFAARSKTLLGQQLENICVANIQTCILLANSYAAERNHGLEAVYFGIANRMAYVLGLHRQNYTDPPILRETKLRVWLSLFMADKWCSPGLGLPREIVRSDPSLDLPLDEVRFQSLRSADDDYLPERSIGIWAYKITLAEILTSIQDVNLSLLHNHVDRRKIDQEVDDIATRLLTWHDRLPPYMTMNDENLEAHRAKGQGGTFVALHFGYHHYSTLLYFQFLEPDRERDEKILAYANRCSYHGLAFSRLLHTARKFGDCHVVYLTVAHMTIVSSSVLLHMLLFGDDAEVEVARLQLSLNFEALEHLNDYWPGVKQLKERLFVFQDACLRSSAARAYAVDRWIVRFLLEYSLPFEKREDDAATTPSSVHSTPISLERRAFLSKALEDVGW
ncbi:NADH dehydrogenase [Boeremia exigua]|uniref:NADH dehydrogenase n=1 Tax=Boeremia exigua TaxID=749465 RepID=UPI001E8E9B66|nr:NADH dehydrogenase [Boeremia exigua]KAH6625211.1 NADH dehydrogenase [Boeremia exigua]